MWLLIQSFIRKHIYISGFSSKLTRKCQASWLQLKIHSTIDYSSQICVQWRRKACLHIVNTLIQLTDLLSDFCKLLSHLYAIAQCCCRLVKSGWPWSIAMYYLMNRFQHLVEVYEQVCHTHSKTHNRLMKCIADISSESTSIKQE